MKQTDKLGQRGHWEFLSSASALFTFNTPPICYDRTSSFQGRCRAGLKQIKRPR